MPKMTAEVSILRTLQSLSSALGELEKCHDAVFQQAVRQTLRSFKRWQFDLLRNRGQ
jgi:hypothetical protein